MKFSCPNCGQHLDGDSSYVGRTISCPSCNQTFIVAPAVAAVPARPVPIAVRPPALPGTARTSLLAVWSLILSLASLILGPLGFIPGIICGHLAKRTMRRTPTLKGRGLAIAGLVTGYVMLVLFVGSIAFFMYYTAQILKAVEQNAGPMAMNRPAAASPVTGISQPAPDVSPAGSSQPWTIDPENADIPAQPAQGPIQGRKFVVQNARFEGFDLILVGNGELRLLGKRPTGSAGKMNFSFPGQLAQAASYSAATLLLNDRAFSERFQVLFKTETGEVNLTPGAEIRLELRAPVENKCDGGIHLAFGPESRDYLLGRFQAELSPELVAVVEAVKPAFKTHPNAPNNP